MAEVNSASSIGALEQGFVERPTTVRYYVLLGLALAVAGAYLTRVMSAASTTIQKEFSLGNEEIGNVLAGFALGYFWFQVPGGLIGTRFGARIVLPALSILWSLCTFWFGVAGSGWELRCSRIALGLAQAGLVPCCAKVMVDWFPVVQRGLASAILGSSMQIGAILASGLTASLLPLLGWRKVFLAYSAVGIVWAIVFYLRFRNRPEEHRSANQAERNLIQGDQPGRTSGARQLNPDQEVRAHELETSKPRTTSRGTVLLVMLTSGSMWANCSLALFRAFGYDFFITWFPAYLEKGHGVQVVSAGMLTMVPLVALGLGSLLGGFLVDALMARTRNKWLSRSGTAAASLSVCALCTLAAAWARNPHLAVLVISCGSFFSGLAGPAAWAAMLDIGGKQTALVAGIANMAGNIGAFACPVVLGHLFSYIEQSSADWNLVLYLFVAIYLAGALCAVALNPNQSAVERSTN